MRRRPLKHVTLELGGKSPLIVFDDAGSTTRCPARCSAISTPPARCAPTARGCSCTAPSRRLPRAAAARTARDAHRRPAGPATQVGALISEEHMEKVLGYIARGRAEGARLLTGGHARHHRRAGQGLFRRADGVRRLPRRHGDRARGDFRSGDVGAGVRRRGGGVARANATEFGLSAGVFTNDLTRAHRVIARLQAGTCWINHYNVTPSSCRSAASSCPGSGARTAAPRSSTTRSSRASTSPWATSTPY
jgi:betaine-aldehyde dehydrogenase